jgi:hypothetical protein
MVLGLLRQELNLQLPLVLEDKMVELVELVVLPVFRHQTQHLRLEL